MGAFSHKILRKNGGLAEGFQFLRTVFDLLGCATSQSSQGELVLQQAPTTVWGIRGIAGVKKKKKKKFLVDYLIIITDKKRCNNVTRESIS